MYSRKNIVGPVAMITVGALFLLQEFSRYSFHNTWPILLIAIGAALVLQRSQYGGDCSNDVPGSSAAAPQTTSEKR
jgi:hypothetical protein